MAGNRSNIAPQNIPWDMIRYLVTETYGGKIDDEGDFNQLRALVHRILTPSAYDIGHKLVEEDGGLVVPSGTSLPDCMTAGSAALATAPRSASIPIRRGSSGRKY